MKFVTMPEIWYNLNEVELWKKFQTYKNYLTIIHIY